MGRFEHSILLYLEYYISVAKGPMSSLESVTDHPTALIQSLERVWIVLSGNIDNVDQCAHSICLPLFCATSRGVWIAWTESTTTWRLARSTLLSVSVITASIVRSQH